MSLFRPGSRQHTRLGVALSADGVSLACVKRRAAQPPRVEHAEFIPLENPAAFGEALHKRLTKLGLGKAPCNLALNPEDYSLPLVEAPRVPADELREALRWKIKDLVDFPVTEAAVDAFLLPEDAARGSNRMAYVAVARKKTVASVVAEARRIHLKLNSIDVTELALRNLAEACCDTSRGVALVRLVGGGGTMQIQREGQLYLARRLSLPYNGGLLDELPAEALVLELQRSLDYFERQMRQPPPGQIFLCGDNVSADKLTDDIKAGIGAPMALLDLNNGLELADSVQEHTLSLCLGALGAALREGAG